MTGVIVAIQAAAATATLVCLFLLLRNFARVPSPARVVLTLLLGTTLALQCSNLLEYLGITDRFDRVEDYVELVLPFLWGTFLYVWFHDTVTEDLARSAQSLDAERQFVATVMRATPAGIVTCNRRGEIIFANQHAERVLGASQAELRQLTFNAPAWGITDETGEPIPETDLPFRRVLDTGTPLFGYRHRVHSPARGASASDDRLLSINAVPVRGADGQVTQVVFTVTDITDETRMQRRVARLNALLRAVRNVNQFVAREKDPALLLSGACERLVSTGAYSAARILLGDTGGDLHPYAAAAAPSPDPAPHIGGLQQVWSAGGVIWPEGLDPHTATQRAGSTRIEHAGRAYGVLVVEVPAALLLTDDESTLLDEVADDIGLALHSLEQEQALRQALDAQAHLLDQLRALVLAGNDLARITSTDELCRRAVELGRDRLGFDRLGIWFRTDDPNTVAGTYGIDEQGQLRNESAQVVPWNPDVRDHVESGARAPQIFHGADLYNDRAQAVGVGTRINATIWDGEHHLGHIAADNLFSHRPLSDHDAETLSLFAATFGHRYGRLKAEQAAHQQDALYRTIFQNTGTAMVVFEADGTLSLVNDETVRLSGYARDEIENRLNISDFLVTSDPATRVAYDVWNEDATITETRPTVEMRVRDRDGNTRDALIAVARIPGTQRTVVSVLDTTSQKEAATAHRRRAAQQTALNTIIAAATRTTDLRHLMATALDETLGALGLTRGIIWLADASVARNLRTDLIPPEHRTIWPGKDFETPLTIDNLDEEVQPHVITTTLAGMLPTLHALQVKGLLAAPIYVDLKGEGRVRIGKLALISSVPRQWSDEEVALVAAVGQQLGSVAERLRLLARIRSQADQLQHVIDSVPDGVVLIDEARCVVLTNLAARSLLGPVLHAGAGEQVRHVGSHEIDELLQPPPRGSWHQVEAGERTFEVIARPMIPTTTPAGWVLVLRDVTEARQIDEHRQQQDRLAAVGRLAAGIAHDFNNIMAVMLLYAQMGTRMPDMPAAGRQHFDIIVQQAHRASNLIQQILDFSRRSALERRPMNLLLFLKEICRLLERTLSETITINFGYDPGEFRVSADPTRMQQVLMNLAINARDAMPDGGELTLWLDNVVVTTDEPPVPDMAPGTWVRLRVSDTGAGMPAPVQSRLFEPFFTTKEPGLGTGLGLAQVHGILMQHKGAIRVDSETGQGTTFTLYLPALDSVHEQLGEDESGAETFLPTGERQLVLVVEDNGATRVAMADTLRSLNYRVLEARDGREGLALLKARSGEIALVLSDAVMPEMGGLALLEAATASGLSLPFIIMSGHVEPGERRRIQTAPLLAGWLPKPMPIEQLAAAVAAALNPLAPKP